MTYQDLEIWKRSMELVMIVYKLVKMLPKEEIYGLSDQMRRAAVSIPSNIAEGHDRQSSKEYRNFVSIAMGSCAELETQFLICERVGYMTREQTLPALTAIKEIGKMGSALLRRLASP